MLYNIGKSENTFGKSTEMSKKDSNENSLTVEKHYGKNLCISYRTL